MVDALVISAEFEFFRPQNFSLDKFQAEIFRWFFWQGEFFSLAKIRGLEKKHHFLVKDDPNSHHIFVCVEILCVDMVGTSY